MHSRIESVIAKGLTSQDKSLLNDWREAFHNLSEELLKFEEISKKQPKKEISVEKEKESISKKRWISLIRNWMIFLLKISRSIMRNRVTRTNCYTILDSSRDFPGSQMSRERRLKRRRCIKIKVITTH